jgi:ATP-dependent Clp protease ATP-binding subunit ClpA
MPFDDWASEACMEAQAEAKRRLRTQINPLHLLFVLLKPDDGPVAEMIRASGGDVRKVQASLEGGAI